MPHSDIIKENGIFVAWLWGVEVDGSENLVKLKKTLSHIYNEVNKEIYGFGVIKLRINITKDMIMFCVEHNRVPALQALEKRYFALKQSVDYALFQEFKLRLGEKLKEDMHLPYSVILRDYDPDSLVAVTIVFLKDNLSNI